MSESILVVNTPKSCSECVIENNCATRSQTNTDGFKTWEKRPPQCPLQDTMELLEVLKLMAGHTLETYAGEKFAPSIMEIYKEEFNKLQKALGGKQ